MASRVKWLILRVAAVWMAAAWSGGSACAADAQIEQARALIRSGQAGQAYTLLEKLEFQRAGEVEFDTVLGIAALDGGKPDKATLAFERVLALDPNAAGARLDMARAYFALGDYQRARQELQLLSANDPPPAARTVIAKYLAAITERERARRTVAVGYLEGFVGHDDNITSVVGDFTNAVLASYNLAGFQPTGNAIMRSSALAGGAAGFDVTHKANDAWSLWGGADVRYRNVLSAANYTSEQLDLRAGASYAAGAEVLRGGVTLQGFRQRTDLPTANRNALGLNAEWRHLFNERDQGSLFGLASRQRYPDIAVNDIDTLIFGGGWLHLFAGAYKPLLYGSLLLGQDNAQNQLANGADNGKRYTSGRAYAQLSLGETLDVFSSLGLMARADRARNARSTTVDYGNDHLMDLTLGLNWRPAPNWTVRPQLLYSENHSNVALSEYRRTEAMVTVRYDFH